MKPTLACERLKLVHSIGFRTLVTPVKATILSDVMPSWQLVSLLVFPQRTCNGRGSSLCA